MIGIILVPHLQIILVGQPQKATSQFMIHVQQVGVFPMVAAMVCGQCLLVQAIPFGIIHTIAPTKACTSPESLAQIKPFGTQLRVGAAVAMAVSAMSAATAAIGLLLLTAATARTACSSPTMPAIRRVATIARTVYLSVVSKNNS